MKRYKKRFTENTDIRVSFTLKNGKIEFLTISAKSKKDFFTQLEKEATKRGLDPYDYKDVSFITNHKWFN